MRAPFGTEKGCLAHRTRIIWQNNRQSWLGWLVVNHSVAHTTCEGLMRIQDGRIVKTRGTKPETRVDSRGKTDACTLRANGNNTFVNAQKKRGQLPGGFSLKTVPSGDFYIQYCTVQAKSVGSNKCSYGKGQHENKTFEQPVREWIVFGAWHTTSLMGFSFE